jgi:hypothetical protein
VYGYVGVHVYVYGYVYMYGLYIRSLYLCIYVSTDQLQARGRQQAEKHCCHVTSSAAL